MRTVATLAAILVLPCGLFADDAQTTNLNIAIPAPAAEKQCECPSRCECPAVMLTGTATPGKYDTSVYQLKHVHARQVIPAVQRAICKHAAEAAGEHAAHTTVSVAFMPTTSDDALIAVCRREHAALVKQAIEECDIARQYAVKVQLFEVTANGETVPVGSPSVIVGKEGSVECKSEVHGPITVSLQVNDSAPEAADSIAKEPVSTDTPEEASCSGPDCGQPAATCPATKGACPVSCSGQASETCVCPACTEAASIGGECGTCEASATVASDCKCGASCKCAGTCKCKKDAVAECSEPSACTCENGAEACAHSAEFTTDEYRALVRILLTHWLQEHKERTDGVARDDAAPASAGDCCSTTETCPTAQSDVSTNSSARHPHRRLKLEVDLGSPAVPSTCTTPGCAEQDVTNANQCPLPVVIGTPAEEGLFIRQMRICAGGGDEEKDDVAVAHVTDSDKSECTCNGSCHACEGHSAEPPALLTLSRLKDGSASFDILISPEWQAELSKKYQARPLSEIFEVHNGQDAGAAALRGLLTVIARPEAESANSSGHHRNAIILNHVRVFDGKCDANAALNCPAASCHDSLRALLEDVLQSPILQSVNQAGHAEYDESVAKSPQQLPSVSHSKIDTTVVTYPLHDLILLDNAERPVFDTCTIIDHLQSAVAPESWAHPSVSIQFDQQTMSLVIRQTPEVHQKIEAHLHDLRRLQVKRLCKMIERLSTESESSED